MLRAKGGGRVKMVSQKERMKYEAARELGLMEKLERVGWAGLSTEESGRVGGIVSGRLRKKT